MRTGPGRVRDAPSRQLLECKGVPHVPAHRGPRCGPVRSPWGAAAGPHSAEAAQAPPRPLIALPLTLCGGGGQRRTAGWTLDSWTCCDRQRCHNGNKISFTYVSRLSGQNSGFLQFFGIFF